MAASPVRDRVLDKQFGSLVRALPSAQRGDVRSVHQARVATRRLRAALSMVEPGPKTGKLVRGVRALTATLGPVRELDVTLQVLEELSRDRRVPVPAIACLRDEVAGERAERLSDLIERVSPGRVEKLRRTARALAGDVAARTRTRPSQVAAARAEAGRRACRLERAVSRAGALYVAERLHEVRIAAKKLRYALEVVQTVSGSRAPARLRTLTATQDTLGRLHDLDVLIERARALQARGTLTLVLSADIDALVRVLDAECRGLHAQYVTSRAALLAVCRQVLAQAAGASRRGRASA
ncbi:MAG: CHAD domain-containing protein [Vicinamibacterales bacterium]